MRKNRNTKEDESSSLFNQFLMALSEAEHVESESKREQIERLLASSKQESFARVEDNKYVGK